MHKKSFIHELLNVIARIADTLGPQSVARLSSISGTWEQVSNAELKPRRTPHFENLDLRPWLVFKLDCVLELPGEL